MSKIQDKYFGKREEQAIKTYLSSDSKREKDKLFEEIINPALIKLIDGVQQMPMFQKIIGITREELAEKTYHHIINNIEKFDESKVGKDGKPVKAYSYFGTAAKNFILYEKIQNDKMIAKRGGVLNSDDFCNVIEDKSRGEAIFKESREETIRKLKHFGLSNNSSKNDLLVCSHLVYMLKNWEQLEFSNKNEFVRLLLNYTGLKSNTVTSSLKKIKLYLKEKDNG